MTQLASDGNPAVPVLTYPFRPTGTPPKKEPSLDGMLMRTLLPGHHSTNHADGTRRCCHCEQWKPLDEFPQHPSEHMARGYTCNVCRRAYNRGYDAGRRYRHRQNGAA